MGPFPVVLVEGRSDVAAVQTLARRRGLLSAHDLRLVDMGGVTNFRREWERHRADPVVLTLCDAGETAFVMRVLRDDGIVADAPGALDAAGCFVCDRDLEDELIRALGAPAAATVARTIGLGSALDVFRTQVVWRERPLADQLRRFAGAGAGRKEALAAAWADALPPGHVPRPLARLLDRVAAAH